MTLFNWGASLLVVILLIIAHPVGAQESSPGDCSDGLDNDGDQLIDYYDDDCPCDGQNYYGTCATACSASTFPATNFTIAEQWRTDRTSYGFDNRQVAMVADIDADGYPEVIAKDDGQLGELYIFDGRDGSHKLTINAPAFKQFNIGLAIADVDLDGFGEIILNTSDKGNSFDYTRRLICYEHNGVEKWRADKQSGSSGNDAKLAPAIADFNGDGIPEIYIGNEIYNAQTGAFIVAGTASLGENSAASGEAFSVAADVLPDLACTHCSGLELVAGNIVYSVDLSGPAMNIAMTAPGSIPDGFTAIADLDNDNDYDAVVTSGGTVYAWDLQSSTQLGTAFQLGTTTAASSNSTAGGVANIADFDGDGQVEIGLAGKHVYAVLEYNSGAGLIEEKWSTYVKDGSGRTGSSVFDFEGDGNFEVVYKGEAFLWVMDGTTGSIKAQIACGSGTRTDYPLVVDVDADGATEIVCSCAEANGPGNANSGFAIAFEAVDRPWVHSRKVWNQFQYNITNINDDLSIPTHPQKGFYVGSRLNNFLSQAPILDEFGDYVIDATDLIVEILSVDVSQCGTNQLEVEVKVSNQGNATAKANTPVAFYQEDPTGLSTYIGTGSTTEALDNGESTTLAASLNVAGLPGTFNLFAVVNSTLTSTPFSYATDFPAGPIPECDYTNNSDSETAGCCGVANAGDIDGFEQSCNSFDPGIISSSNPGGDACVRNWVYYNAGTESNVDRLESTSAIPGFTTTDSDFTFETWIRYIDGPTQNADIIFMNGNNHDLRFQIKKDREPRIRIIPGSNYLGSTKLVDSEWHHLVITYTSRTIKFYIDGALDVTRTSTTDANIDDHVQVQIGRKSVGQLDNIKIYNAALSDAEVLEAFNNCSYRNNGSLQAWWNFDTNTGQQTVVDLIGTADLSFNTSNPVRSAPGGDIPDPAPLVYEWEQANALAGPWSTISNSDSESYDPGSISQTTYFRRGIVNNGSCENSYSSTIEKRVGSALDDGGTIGSDEEGCPGFSSSTISELTPPAYTGSSIPSIVYQWQSANSADGPWSTIPSAVAIDYTPGNISTTSYFRRLSQESGCSEVFYSNVIEKKTIAATFFEAGSISGDEAGCPSYIPSTIIGTPPSGSYNFAYQWQSSSDQVNWVDISGQTSADLSFSTSLFDPTYYRRLVTETGCTVYNVSNTVTKLVKTDITDSGSISDDESICSAYDPTLITGTPPTGGGPTYEYIWEQTNSPDQPWSVIGGATSDSYDPPSISTTTYFRRGVRSNGPSCTLYTYTDPVVKEVFVSNVEENEFSGDEFECGTFDPTAMIDEQSPASGAEFQWESADDPAGPWSEISGATATTYDPGSISTTIYYRRKVRETGCTDWQEPAEYVTKSVACRCGASAAYLPGSNSVKVATDTCSSGTWSYYFDPANPSQLLFGIEHYPSGGNTAPFDADITIETTESTAGTPDHADSPYLKEDQTGQEAFYVMGRSWNIDLLSGSLNGFVNIRFFYDERESDRIENLGEAWKAANGGLPNILNVSNLIWFKTIDVKYRPNTQHTSTGFSISVLELTPAEYGFINGIKYVQFDGITSFSGGSAAVRVGANPILPVELLHFNGQIDGDHHRLQWTTATEQDASHFIVERMDPFSQQFAPISPTIKAAGNSWTEQHYEFINQQPLKRQDNYYRLRMVDLDGSIKHSNILVLSPTTTFGNELNVFPNPTGNTIQFDYRAQSNETATIQIVDIKGQVIHQERRNIQAGLQISGRINLSERPAGTYFLYIIGQQEAIKKAFILHHFD